MSLYRSHSRSPSPLAGGASTGRSTGRLNSLMDDTEVNFMFLQERLHKERGSNAKLLGKLNSERKKNAKLTADVNYLQDTLEEQVQNFNTLKDEVRLQLRAKGETERAKTAILEDELNVLQGHLASATTESAKVPTLRMSLEAEQASNVALQSQLDVAREHHARQEAELNSLEHKLATMSTRNETDLTSSRRKAARAESEVELLQHNVAKLKDTLKVQEVQRKDEWNEWRAQLDLSSSKLASTTTALERARSKEAENAHAIKDLESRLAKEQKRTVRSKHELESVCQELRTVSAEGKAALESKNAEVEEIRKEAARAHRRVVKMEAEDTARISELEQQLQRENRRCGTLSKENAVMKERLTYLERMLSDKEHSIAESCLKLSGLKDRVINTAQAFDDIDEMDELLVARERRQRRSSRHY